MTSNQVKEALDKNLSQSIRLNTLTSRIEKIKRDINEIKENMKGKN